LHCADDDTVDDVQRPWNDAAVAAASIAGKFIIASVNALRSCSYKLLLMKLCRFSVRLPVLMCAPTATNV